MAVTASPVLVSWVFASEDEPIARDLLRLAGVLEKLGLVRNRGMTGTPGGSQVVFGRSLNEFLPSDPHRWGSGIAVFLVSPSVLEHEHWSRLLHDVSLDRETRTFLALVRPVAMNDLPGNARHMVVLPKDGAPIATRRDREDALLEVIQAVQEMATLRPSAAAGVAPRERAGDVLPINDIFRLNGPPTVTFVEPPRFRELQFELKTMGTGLIVEGPSKTGKSTAIHKAMDGLGVAAHDQLWWGGQRLPAFDDFQRALDELLRSEQRRWLFIDDFHYVEDPRYLRALAFAMKALADQARSNAKVTLIGINALGASLVQAMSDLAGRFRIMRIDREGDWERSTLITELIVLGERAANIRFLRRDEFVVAAGGSFFIAQLLCNRAAAQAGVFETQASTVEIERGPADVIASIRDELAARYRSPMLHFAAFDAEPPPRGAGLSLLWLLARSPEGFVSLREARLRFPGLGPVFDWFLQSNLSRCFEQDPELRELLYLNRATGTLTMEDPQLKFTSARSTGPSLPRPAATAMWSSTRRMDRYGRWSVRPCRWKLPPGCGQARGRRPAACCICPICTSGPPIRRRSRTPSSRRTCASRVSIASTRWSCPAIWSIVQPPPSTTRPGCSSRRSSRGSGSRRTPSSWSPVTTTSAGQALQQLPAPTTGELRIATLHHPIHGNEDSRLRDHGFLQLLAVAGFRLILHGHVHRADAALYRYDRTIDGRRIDIVAAGTFGAPVREWVPGYPLEYNLVVIRQHEIVVETRRRREVNGAWEPDARWLQGPGRTRCRGMRSSAEHADSGANTRGRGRPRAQGR